MHRFLLLAVVLVLFSASSARAADWNFKTEPRLTLTVPIGDPITTVSTDFLQHGPMIGQDSPSS